MNEEAKNPKYDCWFHDTTSGSSGIPLMLLVSPKEKAYNMANWFRVMMCAGYNPFTGKTMSRKSAHSISGGSDTFLQHVYNDIDKTPFIEAVQPIHANFYNKGEAYKKLYDDIQKYAD